MSCSQKDLGKVGWFVLSTASTVYIVAKIVPDMVMDSTGTNLDLLKLVGVTFCAMLMVVACMYRCSNSNRSTVEAGDPNADADAAVSHDYMEMREMAR